MPLIRSLLFNAVFYVSIILYMLIGLPILLLPQRYIMMMVRVWSRYFVWLTAHLAGIKMEVRGREYLRAGPLLIAAKHQSLWETMALLQFFDDPCFILKRELTYIPLFGWYLARTHQIPVDRRGGAKVRNELLKRTRQAILSGSGRQLIMFPEGTRRPVGAPPAYRSGIAHVYEALGVAVTPVAMNSGMFWPRRSLKLKPGTIVVEFLPDIPGGLPRDEFMQRLETTIETATNRLIADAQKSA
jgi:1-acyl-sn-glycerol-3-phosphate acyltransferase